MGILTKDQFSAALYEYYTENCGQRDSDIWYEQPSVNVWVFERDGSYINLNSHILTGKVTKTVMDHLPYNIDVAPRPFETPDTEDAYTVVDMTEWKRADLFNFYITQMRVVMSMTVDINVAPLIAYAKKYDLKFYPCMLWVVSKVINSHDEFKYSYDEEGRLIRWRAVSPSHTDFHSEDESFTKYVTEYSEDLGVFYTRCMADREKVREARGILTDQPKNFFDVSCLPWVRYRNFDMHVFDEGKFLAPVVTWGKYEEECRGTIMPLTMNIHHAVADGFHLSRFFCEVQELIDGMDETIRKNHFDFVEYLEKSR